MASDTGGGEGGGAIGGSSSGTGSDVGATTSFSGPGSSDVVVRVVAEGCEDIAVVLGVLRSIATLGVDCTSLDTAATG